MERDLPYGLTLEVGKLSVSLEMRSQFGDCEGDDSDSDVASTPNAERELVTA